MHPYRLLAGKAILPNLASLFLLLSESLANTTALDKTGSKAQSIASKEPDWPQFRGPRRDGICDERGLLPSWPEGGPKLLWTTTNLGHGFSAPIISKGILFISGDVEGELRLSALDLQGGKLWQATNGAAWKGDYPGARASATYSDGRIYHQNAHGRVACFDAKGGKELWSVDLLQKFRGKNITWGMSECLLVDDQAVFTTAGGEDALLVALDKKTGHLLWKSEPLLDSAGERAFDNASYASPILVKLDKRRLLIGCSLKHLFCIDANSGKFQWTQRMPTSYSVLAMMPTLVNDSVFMTAPHGRGGRLFRLIAPTKPEEKVGVEEVWTTRLDTCQQSVVYREGKLFGSFYSGRKGYAAVDAANGEVLYEEQNFPKGALLHADDRLYGLSEDGWMLLFEPGEKDFQIKGKFRLVEADKRDAWAHPVIHEGRLYLRYHETLYCYDIRQKEK